MCKCEGEKSGKDVERRKERKGAGRKREIKRQNLRKIEFNLFFNKKLCSLSDQPKAAKKCGKKRNKTSMKLFLGMLTLFRLKLILKKNC